jgi:hypothetical protein
VASESDQDAVLPFGKRDDVVVLGNTVIQAQKQISGFWPRGSNGKPHLPDT